jgi:hypothetical protein
LSGLRAQARASPLRRTRGLRFRRPDMIRRYQFEIILTLLLLCGALTIFFYW